MKRYTYAEKMLNDTHASEKGWIFDIKEFTLHDGPGVRTTVFFKGCPLHCIWCHNPEGMDRSPTLMKKEALCTHCGLCERPCSHPDCQRFGRCLHICPKGLLSVAGTEVTVGELAARLMQKKDFFFENGEAVGGVTLSGGEPLAQPRFAAALAALLREAGIHVALQTSGYAGEDAFLAVLEHVDYVLFDLKLGEEATHRRYTGVSCVTIHKNLTLLRASGKAHVIRIPLIPVITDTEDNLRQLAVLAGDSMVELMPYNPYAGAKYPMVGKEFSYREQPGTAVDLSIFRHARML